MSTPDIALVALAAGGDDGAFEVLFRRHRADVLAYATRMLGDHGRAEDVVQDVFVSALRAISGAAPASQPTHVRAWLREIARHACIDQWRGTTRRGEVSLDAPGGLRSGDDRRLADDDSLTRATDDRAAVATLRLAFDDLPELQHAILVQRELEGRSIAEIAARLELSTTVVEGQLARGRRALGRSYRELESGERCVAVRALCDASRDGRLGARDRHRVGRHVRGCDACRRHARERGVDVRLLAGAALPAAAFLPLPLLRRLPVDHPLAGDAAGGLLGAKVLVGAAVIAAGGGGMYAAREVTPVSRAHGVAPARDAGASTLGLRQGPGGPVLRVPGGGTFAATAVLPARASGSGAGTHVAGPYRPPWLPDAAAVAPGVGASGLAAVPSPSPAGPSAPAAASAPPAGVAHVPSGPSSTPGSPTRDAVSPGTSSSSSGPTTSSSASSSSTSSSPSPSPSSSSSSSPAATGASSSPAAATGSDAGEATPAVPESNADVPAAAPTPAAEAPATDPATPSPDVTPAVLPSVPPEDEPTETDGGSAFGAPLTAASDGGTDDGD